jgi:tRNA A37 methylthiotransferase MiaB
VLKLSSGLIKNTGKDISFVGRNYTYKPVIVKGDYKIGDEINVKIKETRVFDLRGEES